MKSNMVTKTHKKTTKFYRIFKCSNKILQFKGQFEIHRIKISKKDANKNYIKLII